MSPAELTRSRSEPAEKLNQPAVAEGATRAVDSQGRPVNRRKHMRVRVSFTACVRHAQSGEDMVECRNVSKGGLCFDSKKPYALGALLEIAAPFSPGTPALFVAATVRQVQALGDGQFFRYGVAYLDPSSAR